MIQARVAHLEEESTNARNDASGAKREAEKWKRQAEQAEQKLETLGTELNGDRDKIEQDLRAQLQAQEKRAAVKEQVLTSKAERAAAAERCV